MPPEAQVPQGLITSANAWQFGVLGVVVVVLGWVVWYLFRRYDKRTDENTAVLLAMEKERSGWLLEREKIRSDNAMGHEKLRSEFEAKHRELSDRYARELTDQVKLGRENESAARREFADTLEAMAENQAKQSAASVSMIDKLTERIVKPSGPSGRYP